jgi:hypothetical protein
LGAGGPRHQLLCWYASLSQAWTSLSTSLGDVRPTFMVTPLWPNLRAGWRRPVGMATRSGERLTSADLRVATRDIPNIRELLRRLVSRGLLYRPTRGTYRFALPLFGTYLRRHRKVTSVTRSVTFEAEAHLGAAP